jgi:hypothetical protein
LIPRGRRLGENDNWIAGFARDYREPLISRDRGFDAVPGLGSGLHAYIRTAKIVPIGGITRQRNE